MVLPGTLCDREVLYYNSSPRRTSHRTLKDCRFDVLLGLLREPGGYDVTGLVELNKGYIKSLEVKCFSGKFCWETLKGSITGTLRASGFLSEKIPTMKIPTRKVNNPLTFQRILNEPLINPFLRSFLKEIFFFFFKVEL